jgi:hypothetical protein
LSPIIDALRNKRASRDIASGVALLAMAAIVFPEGLSGRLREDGTITYNLYDLPDAVKNFGLAGGLNLTVSKNDARIVIPRGCVWQLMSELVDTSTARSNVEEVKAFVRVARSVETENGHVFERLLACELSMMGPSGTCPLYNWVAKAWKGEGRLVPDPLVFGQPFVYEGRIREIVWSPHQVYCVRDAALDVGRRVVDLGFPIWLVDTNTNARQLRRVMCEVKKGYTTSELWRLCWSYFDTMKAYAAAHADVIVCFVASEQFSQTDPRQSKVKKAKDSSAAKKQRASAHDSREQCLRLMEENTQYCIVEAVVNHSRFPLGAIFSGVEDPDVHVLADGVSSVYLGTPRKID